MFIFWPGKTFNLVSFKIVQVDEESLRLGSGARESPILVVDRNGGSQVGLVMVILILLDTRSEIPYPNTRF